MSARRAYNQVLPTQFEDAFGIAFFRREDGTQKNLLEGRKIKSPFVGENWKAQINLKNVFSFAMENIRLQIWIEARGKREATLFDTNTKNHNQHKTALKPGEFLDIEVEHLFERLEDFNLVIQLGCQTSDGSDSKRYTHALDISTINAVNFRVHRHTINELLLIEVLVFISLKTPVTIENVSVSPVPMFTCTDLSQSDGPINLGTNMSRSYLFQMEFKQKSNPVFQAAVMSGSVVINWRCDKRFGSVRSELQQRDRLNSRLAIEPSRTFTGPAPHIELALLQLPSHVPKGDVFEIPIELRNNEEYAVEIVLEFRNIDTSIVPYGNSLKNFIGTLQPKKCFRDSLWYVGLACGIQPINGVQATVRSRTSPVPIQANFHFLHYIEIV